MPATEAFFKEQGLPAWLAWFDIRFEVVIAAGLILGIYVPLLCLTSLPILFASMWIYRKNGFYFSGGGIELPVLWACAQVAQVFLAQAHFASRFRDGCSFRRYWASRNDGGAAQDRSADQVRSQWIVPKREAGRVVCEPGGGRERVAGLPLRPVIRGVGEGQYRGNGN
jgi:hypothetical protein